MPAPAVILPVVLMFPVFTLPTLALPVTERSPASDNKFVVLLKVRFALAPALPASLNIT